MKVKPYAVVIVAGSREFDDYRFMRRILDHHTFFYDRITVKHGGAPGADTLADRWGHHWWHLVQTHRPQYRSHGDKQAPIIRNAEMVKETVAEVEKEGAAGVLVAFWNGKSHGTADIIDKAKRAGLRVIEVKCNLDDKGRVLSHKLKITKARLK